MPTQAYGVTGRRMRTSRVPVINAMAGYLPEMRSLEDTKKYNEQMLALENERLATETGLARDRMAEAKRQNTRANMIGVGQLGADIYFGNRRDKAVEQMISGGGGGEGGTPMTGGGTGFAGGEIEAGRGNIAEDPGFFSKEGITDMGRWKEGAMDFGTHLASGAAGYLGAELGEEVLPFGKTANRAIGGGAASGALSYATTQDPYTAAIDFVLGAGIGLL